MPRILIFYHYFHPDPVVSAALYSELAADLARRGWDVVAMPSNRLYADFRVALPAREQWRGVDIRRVWRPRFSQQCTLGRLLNAAWLIGAWSLAALRRRALPDIDVVLVGTDPILGVLVALPWKWFRPRTRRVHWCFDLYPEAAEADGWLRRDRWLARCLRRLLRRAYRACDLVADIGPCMRQRLEAYTSDAEHVTLPPWALAEPEPHCGGDDDTEPTAHAVRPGPADVDSTETGLRVLYAGSLGRAHDATPFFELARRLRDVPVTFAFSFPVLNGQVRRIVESLGPEDRNIRLWEPVDREFLAERLRRGDIHAVSLRPEWTGTVVPSKFFASLAAGRPVLFYGSPDSGPALWIERHRVGLAFTMQTLQAAERWIRDMLADPDELRALQRRCLRVYHRHFSRRIVEDRWERHLRKLANPAAEPIPTRPPAR